MTEGSVVKNAMLKAGTSIKESRKLHLLILLGIYHIRTIKSIAVSHRHTMNMMILGILERQVTTKVVIRGVTIIKIIK